MKTSIKISILFLSLALFIISSSIVSATTYTSSGFTLRNARIVVSGGKATSLNYSLGNVRIGNIFGGKVKSENYSIDARGKYIRETPPRPPELNPVVSPTNVSTQTLSGQKESGTSIYVNGYEGVPLNNETSWNYNVNLTEGENHLLITARNRFGLESASVHTSITLDTVPPMIVITNPQGSPLTSLAQITLGGAIDGVPFTETRNLVFGLNLLQVAAQDAAGNAASKNIEVYRVREPLALP